MLTEGYALTVALKCCSATYPAKEKYKNCALEAVGVSVLVAAEPWNKILAFLYCMLVYANRQVLPARKCTKYLATLLCTAECGLLLTIVFLFITTAIRLQILWGI